MGRQIYPATYNFKDVKKRASKCFTNPKDALEAFNELVEMREPEKSVKRNRRACEVNDSGQPLRKPMGHARAVEKQAETDSRGSFWNSYPTDTLSPEQRRHLKTIMEKEVRE